MAKNNPSSKHDTIVTNLERQRFELLQARKMSELMGIAETGTNTSLRLGYIYIITAPDIKPTQKSDNGKVYCKIGHSGNPKKRMVEMNVGCPEELKMAYRSRTLVNRPKKKERAIHRELARYKTHREWFYLPLNVAIQAVKKITRKA